MMLSRLVTLWLIVFSFAAQPLLNYLANPYFLETGEGIRVVICTLEGERQLTLDLSDGAEPQSGHCSALQLQHLLSSLQMPSHTPPVLPVLQQSPATGPVLVRLPDAPLRYYNSRAPPVV